MPTTNGSSIATVNSVALTSQSSSKSISLPEYDKARLEEVGFLTAMTLVLMGNYA